MDPFWPHVTVPRLSGFGRALRLGLRSLAAHRLRSALSALAIVLGVGSVIVMLANGAVLGGRRSEILFPSPDPIGGSVTIESGDRLRSFTVIGVTEPRTLAAGTDGGDVDFSRVMFSPFATDRVRLGREQITATT